MPDNGVECLGMRRYARIIDGWNHDHGISNLFGVAAIATDNAEYASAVRFGFLQCRNNIGADVLLHVAAADREHKDRVLAVNAAYFQPFGKDRVPAFVVGARGSLGNVIGWGIGLDTAQFAKIINRVIAIAGTAADADYKKAPAAIA